MARPKLVCNLPLHQLSRRAGMVETGRSGVSDRAKEVQWLELCDLRTPVCGWIRRTTRSRGDSVPIALALVEHQLS